VTKEEKILQTTGLLVYGYAREDALLIRSFTERLLGFSAPMRSASNRTEEKISDLLKNTLDDFFADEAPKIVMLVNFSKEQINVFLREFPNKEAGLQRPLFCVLTRQNGDWPFVDLIEHLQEEHRHWTGKKP
jgi:hypothetical protein